MTTGLEGQWRDGDTGLLDQMRDGRRGEGRGVVVDKINRIIGRGDNYDNYLGNEGYQETEE